MAAAPPFSGERVVIWRQIAVGLALFGLYLLVDGLGGPERRAAADRHARDLDALQRHLHLDVEATVNGWLAPHHTWSTLANYEYAYTYVLSALAVIVWVIAKRPEVYRRVRTSFIVLNLAAFACFALYPVTPPRLLPELGLVDTVSRGRTVGSWGSGLVDQANQLAAMPSLHVGWALWVSAVLAQLTARRWVQVVSAVHVLLTVVVIVATANHFVLDAVAAVVLVAVSTRVANAWHDRRDGHVVPSNDAFFLHVERTGAPQHVGGVVIFEPGDDEPAAERIRKVVTAELDRLPRFRQRLDAPGRWRRPRWTDVDVLDLSWHVSELRTELGLDGLHRTIADLAEEPMPRDRPLWRVVLVRDVAPRRSALVLLVHHTIADGIGVVIQALALMRPRIELPAGSLREPSAARRATGTAIGLAQLATDGRPRSRLGPGSPRRQFATADLDLDLVRAVAARHGVRVTDLVLALTGDAVAAAAPNLAVRLGRLRVAVPLMVRRPGTAAEGNATAAVMVDVPLDDRPFADRLAEVAERTARLRTPTRALASRFVMATGLRVLPEPAAAWFARVVYGRRFFHAIASNMPGPAERLTMGGAGMDSVYPILPLAPGAPLALGALSWTGVLGVGVCTDPDVLDAGEVAERMERTLADLAQTRRGPDSRGAGAVTWQVEDSNL